MCPLTITAYGSESYLRNGAALRTRACMSRTYMILEWGVTWPEMSGLTSPKRRAKAALRRMEPMGTPPVPS